MYHILLSLIAIGAPLDCEHSAELLDSVSKNPNRSERLELTRVVVAHTNSVCFKDAQVDWRNGLINLLLWRNQMAQVTYRGVKYDTNNKKAQQTKEVELTYRGIAHAK